MEKHEFWKMLGNEKPKRNYNTVRNLYLYMEKLLRETLWNEDNSYAVHYAFLNQPKVNKVVIKALCKDTKKTYQETEK